jgi:hypothetical protein
VEVLFATGELVELVHAGVELYSPGESVWGKLEAGEGAELGVRRKGETGSTLVLIAARSNRSSRGSK